MHVAVAPDAAHVQHLRERTVGESALFPPCCVPRARRSYRTVGAAREINGVRFRKVLRQTLPHGGGSRCCAASSRIAIICVCSLVHRSVPFTHSSGSPRFGSARARLAWLRSAWIGLARPTTRSYASARGLSARERSTFGVTRLSTSARANHGRLRRAARWRLRRLRVRNARPSPLLPRRVRRFLLVAPFHPLYPASSLARSLARTLSAP